MPCSPEATAGAAALDKTAAASPLHNSKPQSEFPGTWGSRTVARLKQLVRVRRSRVARPRRSPALPASKSLGAWPVLAGSWRNFFATVTLGPTRHSLRHAYAIEWPGIHTDKRTAFSSGGQL